MGRLLWLAAALGADGCGKVAAVADASIDASTQHDAPACTSSQLACSTGCTDPMTDMANCGSCGAACQTTRETCTSGECVDIAVSCFTLKAAGKPTAVYTLANGELTYCDMGNNATYASLSMNNFNQGFSNYVMVALTDFTTPGPTAAFIALYNAENGAIPILTPPMDGIGNCAIKLSSTASKAMFMGGALTGPSTPGGAGPELCQVSYTDPVSFQTLSAPIIFAAAPPMPADFFTQHPVTEGAGTDGNNPAFFWVKGTL